MQAQLRKLKYTLGARIIDLIVSHTSLLNRTSLPPELINFAGGGDFEAIGDATVNNLLKLAGLNKGAEVLEIGCGIARNAIALENRFGPEIRYRGFDVVRYGISWSNRRFSAASEAYQFRHANIFNSFYNPSGRISASEYTFEYANEHFDIVFATSVFTHMQHRDFVRFLDESLRVLKPGGRLFFTAFLLDEHSEKCIKADQSRFSFQFPKDHSRVETMSEPDLAVAHDRAFMQRYLARNGFADLKVYEGIWRGEAGVDFQDIVVVTKP